jgi:hypothetical protein
MRTSRITRLERRAGLHACPGCAGAFRTSNQQTEAVDVTRLSVAEQRELAQLIAETSTPPCARCGWCDFALRRMTNEQLVRADRLLGKLLGETEPARTDFGDATNGGLT